MANANDPYGYNGIGILESIIKTLDIKMEQLENPFNYPVIGKDTEITEVQTPLLLTTAGRVFKLNMETRSDAVSMMDADNTTLTKAYDDHTRYIDEVNAAAERARATADDALAEAERARDRCDGLDQTCAQLRADQEELETSHFELKAYAEAGCVNIADTPQDMANGGFYIFMNER